MADVTVMAYEVVGSQLCVASDDGQKVYDRIEESLRSGRSVAVSFLNVETLTSAFLNAAVGQLYGTFKEDEIREGLSVEDMDEGDVVTLKRVVNTAKLYFKDPARFKQTERDVLGEDDE